MECNPAQLRGIYERFAPRYDRHLLWLQCTAGLLRLRRSLLKQAIGDVLEVAIGTGANLPFYDPTCTISGIDLSPDMLKLAEQRAQTIGRDVKLAVMDAESLTFPEQSFDTVVSTLSLCTIPHPHRAIREMARVCRQEGKMLFLEHGPSHWKPIAKAQKWLVGDWHVRKYGCHWDREPDRMVEEAGLPILSHQRTFFGTLHTMEVTPPPEGTP